MPKENSSSKNLLLQQFAEGITSIEKLEKQLAKIYGKMQRAAYTDELSKCLSPVSTDNIQHLSRIELIRSSLGKKPRIKNQDSSPTTIKLKKSGLAQDIDIIRSSLAFQNQKLGVYEFLHPLAVALEMTTEAQLIEQTITDNRNTNTWLRQIIQNILVPKIIGQSAHI